VRGLHGAARRRRTSERRGESRGEPRRRTGERAKTSQRVSPQTPSHNTQVRGVINTITGGFAGGGSSASARKKHLRVVQAVNTITMPIR